jgi:diguanylate cyclase (GGDEF)-like protein/PAS domain S-box-containing protein
MYNHTQARIAHFERAFQVYLNDNVGHLLGGLADFIRRDSSLKKAWIAKDREALLDNALPLFYYINKNFRVSHFSFHSLNKAAFLRVDHPEATEDMERTTLNRAVAESEPQYGIELSQDGIFRLDLVTPWWISGELIGYIDLGTEIRHFVRELANVLDMEIFLVAPKKYINHELWEKHLEQTGVHDDWDRFKDMVVLESTSDGILERLQKKESIAYERFDSGQFVVKDSSTAKTYRGSVVPLKSADQRIVGHIIALNDVTDEENALHGLLGRLSIVFILLGGILLVLFSKYLGQIEKKLASLFKALTSEIDERKRVHQKLQHSQERLAKAQEIARLGNWDWNVATDELWWSDEIYRIFGATRKEFGATYEAFRDFVHPEDREFVKNSVHEALSGQKPYSIDFRILLSDKTERIVHEEAEVTLGEDMRPRRMMGTVQDITERKKSEDELRTLHKKLGFEKRKLEELLSIDQTMRTILDLNHLVDFIIEKAIQILEAGKCSLMLLDPESQELLIRGAIGLDGDIVRGTRVKMGESIAGVVAQDGNPLLVRNIETEKEISRKNNPKYTSKSFMCVPLKVHNKLVGVINVADKKNGEDAAFTPLDLRILCAIVRQATISIENASYYRKLEHLSMTDSLTELFNHRYFIQALDNEIDRAKRYPKSLCLLMMDIDDFKSYNDTYGHLGGDRLLKDLSKILKQNLRSVDIVCRYAGDEFVAILPETDIPEAKMIADKIKRVIGDLKLFEREVTVSIGIAKYSSNRDRRDLIMKADQALYQSKREGKNRVSCFH